MLAWKRLPVVMAPEESYDNFGNKEYCGDVAFVMKKSPSENERYVTTCTCGTPRPEKKIVKNSCTDEE